MPYRPVLATTLSVLVLVLVLALAAAGCGNVPQPDTRDLPAEDRAEYAEAQAGIRALCATDSQGGRSGREHARLAEDLHTVIRLARRFPNAAGPGPSTLRADLVDLAERMPDCDRKSARRLEVALRTIG